MIRGKTRNREARIELEILGTRQSPQRIEAVIDTGYNGYLTLPTHLVTTLQLLFAGYRSGMLADGNVTRLNVYLATIMWHGRQKDVLISATSGTPLIGMSLLAGSRLTIDVLDDGEATIEELKPTR